MIPLDFLYYLSPSMGMGRKEYLCIFYQWNDLVSSQIHLSVSCALSSFLTCPILVLLIFSFFILSKTQPPVGRASSLMSLLLLPRHSREAGDRNGTPVFIIHRKISTTARLRRNLTSCHQSICIWMRGFISTWRDFEDYPVQLFHFKNQKAKS